MTETSPVGTISRLKGAMRDWPEEEKLRVRVKQGIPVACLEARILGLNDEDLPRDGEHAGELVVRGPWVARSHYNNPEARAAFTEDGWFRTGDLATIDALGYVQVIDRTKDLIKRKGEWISSIAMEDAVQAHPGVLEAAVVERPTSSAARCRWSSSSSETTRTIRSRWRTSSSCSAARSPAGSYRSRRTSTSSRRCPGPASGS
jgi:fatty-acyl-CoA synthase